LQDERAAIGAVWNQTCKIMNGVETEDVVKVWPGAYFWPNEYVDKFAHGPFVHGAVTTSYRSFDSQILGVWQFQYDFSFDAQNYTSYFYQRLNSTGRLKDYTMVQMQTASNFMTIAIGFKDRDAYSKFILTDFDRYHLAFS